MERLVKYNCDYCGKEIEIKISKYNRKINGKQKNISCCKDCKNKLQSLELKSKDKKSGVEKICLHCGKIYYVYAHKENSSKFCCRECKDKYNAEKAKIIIYCETCGKKIETLKGKVNRGKRFCSNECAAKSKKNRVIKICEICKKEYETHNRRSENSVTCSKECHNKWLSLYSQREEVKERLRKQGTKTSSLQKSEYTKPELMVLEYLKKVNVNYIPQYIINDILIADFYLPDFNCILEVYGDYWHANPSVYGEKDTLKPLNEMQLKNKNRDIRKYKVIKKKLGFNFYILWEKDIYNNLDNKMEEFFNYINTKIRNESVS